MSHRILAALIFFSTLANADDWLLLSSDPAASSFLSTSSIQRDARGDVRFRLKHSYSNPRDMMGLQYDAMATDYRVACKSRMIVSRQQFLLSGDEVVWTHPVSDKKVAAGLELSEELLRRVC